MINKVSRASVRTKKHRRMRHHIVGTAQRPRLAVFRRILKNRSIGKTHGHTGNDHNCTEDQNGYRGKNNTLDTFELPYDQSRKTVFFHLRFSLAYSVGVHPVAFLKEIPK